LARLLLGLLLFLRHNICSLGKIVRIICEVIVLLGINN
jgi:hypothetical protein